MSQSVGVRTRKRPRYRGWEYVWTGIKKGRINDWRKTFRKKNKQKKIVGEAQVHFGLSAEEEEKEIGTQADKGIDEGSKKAWQIINKSTDE